MNNTTNNYFFIGRKWAIKDRVTTYLTKKEIRYAMIKGKNEKKHLELKPWYCKPDPTLIKLADEFD